LEGLHIGYLVAERYYWMLVCLPAK